MVRRCGLTEYLQMPWALFGRLYPGQNPLLVTLSALEKIRPLVSLYSKKVGGTSYKIPNIVSPRRSYATATRWLIQSARKRPELNIAKRLAQELINCYNGNATALLEKTRGLHKAALHSRPFIRFRRKRRNFRR